LMMSLWDALRMNMMISYQELVRTFPNISSAYSHSSGGWARDYIFIYGGKFSFLCKSLNRYLSYISYSADSE
ncbi:hypothetical protein OU624_02175, partial [Escherichia coli]|nr:hypothetical protein [Escherichia coli]MDF8922719.1 hypothetical protein [Escherichia coli]